MAIKRIRGKQTKASLGKHYDRLMDGVVNGGNDEVFETYLRAQSMFHLYSPRNVALILMQDENATKVAGYTRWQDLGRQVQKGEKGLYIMAPRFWKEKDENGDETGRTVPSFWPVKVFDIRQTQGKPLPAMVNHLEESEDFLQAVIESYAVHDITFEEKTVYGGAYGFAKQDRTIVLNSVSPHDTQASTAIHELAHVLMHMGDDCKLTSSIKELEAEAVAAVVMMHYGWDITANSAAYIANHMGDVSGFTNSMKRVQKTALVVIEGIDEYLEE